MTYLVKYFYEELSLEPCLLQKKMGMISPTIPLLMKQRQGDICGLLLS